jgi:hypothetical protein|tara:strand:+ start:398 stop:937 length:540 start_codon:yes stop_codon:yes gene_type:complete
MKKQENEIEVTKVEQSAGGDVLKLEYDDISPFTGNKCVLIEADEKTGTESRICMESGYTTMDRFVVGSRAIEAYEKMIPELYRDTKYTDQLLNQIWFLSTMRTQKACLYAMGTTKDDFEWKLALVKELSQEEKENYPVEGKDPVEYHTHIVDVDNAETFANHDFKTAIDKFYSTMQVGI